VGSNSEWDSITECETEKNHDDTILITVVGLDLPLSKLIDTGAQISVLKRGLITDNISIRTDNQ
jgi:hypothetical protein